MKRILLLLFLVLLCAMAARSQQTPVTAQVLDPNNLPYSFGTGAATLRCPGNAQASFNGSPIMQMTIPMPGLDGNGNFSMTLYDINLIAPTGCKYTFAICYKDGITCFTTGQIGGITGSTQVNLTTAIKAYSVPLPVVSQPASITGNNAFTGNNTHSGTETFANINNVVYVGGLYPTLASAVTACGNTNPCWIIDNFPETFTASPFTGYTGPGMWIQLGTGHWIWNVAGSLTIPNKVLITGAGRGGGTDSSGTRIAPGASFPINTSLIVLGNTTANFGVRLENLGISCNGVTGSVGVENAASQEQSGLAHVLIDGCLSKGAWWHTANAQNSEIRDIEVLATIGATAAGTVGVQVDTVTGFRGMSGVTVNFTGNTQTTSCIVANSAGKYEDLSVENCVKGIDVQAINVEVHNAQGNSSNTPTVVTLESGVQGFIGTAICCGLTNSVNNLDNSHAFTQANFPLYMYGIGATRAECYFALTLFNCTAANFTTASIGAGSAITSSGPGGALTANAFNLPTLTLKKGNGAGNYTSASTTYVVVDSTNLCNTVTIPTGWKLGISASGALSTATAAVVAQAALTDNAACSTANAGILVETAPIQGAGIGIADAFALNWVITGDGAAHNIAMQFKTSNAADTASLINSSATVTPTMKFELMPSN